MGAINYFRYRVLSALGITLSSNGNALLFADGFKLGNGILIQGGTGTPEGTVTAPVGSFFFRSDGQVSTTDTVGSTIYRKNTDTGNTGWAVLNL